MSKSIRFTAYASAIIWLKELIHSYGETNHSNLKKKENKTKFLIVKDLKEVKKKKKNFKIKHKIPTCS